MSDRVEEIRARLDAATPGPWGTDERYHGKVYCDDSLGSMVADTGSRYTIAITREKEAANADLIAHAPADLAWCLAEIERLRAATSPASVA